MKRPPRVKHLLAHLPANGHSLGYRMQADGTWQRRQARGGPQRDLMHGVVIGDNWRWMFRQRPKSPCPVSALVSSMGVCAHASVGVDNGGDDGATREDDLHEGWIDMQLLGPANHMPMEAHAGWTEHRQPGPVYCRSSWEGGW